jgi:hypothetical protein
VYPQLVLKRVDGSGQTAVAAVVARR